MTRTPGHSWRRSRLLLPRVAQVRPDLRQQRRESKFRLEDLMQPSCLVDADAALMKLPTNRLETRFSHGGPEYDAKYPDGIPTAIDITLKSGKARLGPG